MEQQFYYAWNFLINNPVFEDNFGHHLYLEVVMVNPATEEIDDNKELNTAVRVWLECGIHIPPEQLSETDRENLPDGVDSHDTDWDCGAPTFEEAICKLADLVKEKYPYEEEGFEGTS